MIVSIVVTMLVVLASEHDALTLVRFECQFHVVVHLERWFKVVEHELTLRAFVSNSE